MTPSHLRLPAALLDVLGGLPNFALAFSGGVDSRFLAYAARLAGCNLILLHANGPHISPGDREFGKLWAAKYGLPYYEVEFNPLELPHVRDNSRERCYSCKKALLGAIKREMARHGFAGWPLCDGSQLDDAKAYRPGQKALTEEHIRSPLLEARLDKKAIRHYGAELGLENWDQKARPCLLTRLAYGIKPEAAQLAKIDACEMELTRLLAESESSGIDFRLRVTPEPVLQWSGKMGYLRGRISRILEKHGFVNAAMQEDGIISGYFDRVEKQAD